MSLFTDSLSGMRAQAKAEIEAAAATCTLKRFNPTTDSSGRKTGSYDNVSTTVPIWIQPTAGNSQVRQQGLNAETTHLAFQAHDGTALLAGDRITNNADSTYAYDVIHAHVLETHRMAELKLVKRV